MNRKTWSINKPADFTTARVKKEEKSAKNERSIWQ